MAQTDEYIVLAMGSMYMFVARLLARDPGLFLSFVKYCIVVL